ncbi:MAG: FAD/FMN-dependent dehydrogenase [Pseudonocardia sp.]|nr:FAD/FMN-dependent dehydrogenase [Pseudonocardia sp.]
MRGRLLGPGDPGYDASRAVFNSMIDRRPLAVIRCADASDAVRGITFARRHHLPLSVRGGGHSVAGNAVVDGAVMLDMSGMKAVTVDSASKTVRADPGLTLGEFDRATQAFGLATTLGVVSITGIAGLTLGGGLGWLNGRYGLACDNLISAEVATADGQLLRASARDNEDLFWGIRGGGGNFGVVTSFEYQLHPVDLVLAGGLSYPMSIAPEVLRFYDDFVKAAPDELSTAASLALTPAGEPAVSIVVCYCGALDEGERVLRPLRTFQAPAHDSIQAMPYTALQSAPDEGFPSGRLHYWKSGYLRDLTDGAIETLLRFVARMPSSSSGVGLQQMHGVASRVAPSATAFPHRAEQYDFLILSQWSDAADSERNIEWTRALFEAMEPHLEDAVYVNNLGDEGPGRVRAAYGENYPRLAAVKKAYDPDNLFRANQNIAPPADMPSREDEK